MEYKMHPGEVTFQYLVRKGMPVIAGFLSEKDAADYALSVGGTKFSDREKDAIRELISQDIPMRRIAEEFKCSVGYVHKLKCEHPL